ncbi:hypothetical protein [Kangiella sediminilitoris]|uniref:Uncharacterized protein n=1 Tax=Kangiella sediminilitoris TaxID=1144748 RepID=A0A1B3BB09_9GAMM|nr:hypothetical protein [Kangiella sediminilitoris]AOE49967.1 hypothetical protein KS2013_1250 [Kangiella sediminilitoris]
MSTKYSSDNAMEEAKEIDEVIKQVANDASLYGLDASKVQEIWLDALLRQVADNELDKKAH